MLIALVFILFGVATNNKRALAFITVPSSQSRRASVSAVFAAGRSEPNPKSEAKAGAKEGHDNPDDSNYETYFRDYVSKNDVSTLLSACTEIQKSQLIGLNDSCKIIDDQQHAGIQRVVATRDVTKGEVLTLFPIHAIGLRNVRDSNTGAEYMEFSSDADEEIFRNNIDSTIKLNVPVSLEMKHGNIRDPVAVIIGKKPFIRLFIMALPGKEVTPGWLGGAIKEATNAEDVNCVVLPLPYAAPFCAIVATKDIKESDEVLLTTQLTDWGLEQELTDAVASNQKKNVITLRNQLQKAFVGPFREINLNYPGVKRIHKDPDIYSIDNLLTEEECDRLIAKARPYLEEDRIYDDDSDGYIQPPAKTYESAIVPQREIPSIINKITSMACCSKEEVGSSPLLHYKEGQKILPHVDDRIISDDQLFGGKSDLGNQYHRWAVVFYYLNDVANGGTTCFPELDLDIKPKKGMGLIHFPCDVYGRVDGRTLHGSFAVDEKWIMATSLWNTTDISFEYIDSKEEDMSSDII